MHLINCILQPVLLLMKLKMVERLNEDNVGRVGLAVGNSLWLGLDLHGRG
jgi:hypothetical protein